MANFHILVLLIGTVIVAGIGVAVYYIDRMFRNIFNLVKDIQVDVKDAHEELKKLKEDSIE